YGSEGGEPGNGSLPYPYRTEYYVTDGILRHITMCHTPPWFTTSSALYQPIISTWQGRIMG
ncbi:MAG TPA: hypothetical protein P5342_03695, partial [Candidatus Cloacimonadota bacterium]|nr:hypothetical protein [Candidatus Cloacimonadota bacterium]